jgi:hypothetical protein
MFPCQQGAYFDPNRKCPSCERTGVFVEHDHTPDEELIASYEVIRCYECGETSFPETVAD